MLASGVEAQKASLMYMAVYEASSRWGENQNEHLSQEKVLNLMGVDAVAEHDLKNLSNTLISFLEQIRIELNSPQNK
jgi:hypothetical protein